MKNIIKTLALITIGVAIGRASKQKSMKNILLDSNKISEELYKNINR